MRHQPLTMEDFDEFVEGLSDADKLEVSRARMRDSVKLERVLFAYILSQFRRRYRRFVIDLSGVLPSNKIPNKEVLTAVVARRAEQYFGDAWVEEVEMEVRRRMGDASRLGVNSASASVSQDFEVAVKMAIIYLYFLRTWVARFYIPTLPGVMDSVYGLQMGEVADFTSAFLTAMLGSFDRHESYFQTLTSHSVNFTRNVSALFQMERMGVTYYRWNAIIDRKTCSTCMNLDGTLFVVSELAERARLYINSNPMIGREIFPWVSDAADMRSGTVFPPIHAYCRCFITAL
jgi:SPP1 gp7 family putative phage head morphogenesis protein